MITLSDRYGDLTLEDVEEFEGLEPDNEKEIDFESTFTRGETRSFDKDFGDQLDQTLAELEAEESEWPEFEEISSDQFETIREEE